MGGVRGPPPPSQQKEGDCKEKEYRKEKKFKKNVIIFFYIYNSFFNCRRVGGGAIKTERVLPFIVVPHYAPGLLTFYLYKLLFSEFSFLEINEKHTCNQT